MFTGFEFSDRCHSCLVGVLRKGLMAWGSVGGLVMAGGGV